MQVNGTDKMYYFLELTLEDGEMPLRYYISKQIYKI